LRDDTKNGCERDLGFSFFFRFMFPQEDRLVR